MRGINAGCIIWISAFLWFSLTSPINLSATRRSKLIRECAHMQTKTHAYTWPKHMNGHTHKHILGSHTRARARAITSCSRYCGIYRIDIYMKAHRNLERKRDRQTETDRDRNRDRQRQRQWQRQSAVHGRT